MRAVTWATSACLPPVPATSARDAEPVSTGAGNNFDARYNTPRIGRVLMVRGRDATDGAMMTSFGQDEMKLFRVWTDEVTGAGSGDDLKTLLQRMPGAPALTLASAGSA